MVVSTEIVSVDEKADESAVWKVADSVARKDKTWAVVKVLQMAVS